MTVLLLAFLFGKLWTMAKGTLALASGWGSCRASRSLVKELIHFLRADCVKGPVEGPGRIWERSSQQEGRRLTYISLCSRPDEVPLP